MSEKTLSLYCLKYAQSVLPQSMAFYGGSQEKAIPISFAFYLIKTQDKNILVDAGCDYMPGFVMEKYYSPAFVLRQAGLSSQQITDVIITHAHHDHIEALRHFKNAALHITKQEYLNGKKYIPNDMTVNIIGGEYEIAPQVRIIEWGGHSLGSAIVEITSEENIHLLAGDECYINDCITRKIPTGTFENFDKSTEFVEKFSNKKYRVHTCHDISLKTEKIL